MNETLEAIRQVTQGTSWEGGLWLVGGWVRDELLGRPASPDVDLVLEGDAGEVARHLENAGLTEGQPVLYRRFGTAMVRIGGTTVEFVQARRESYAPDSRKPEVEPAHLIDDARRRDFTANALMRNLHTGELIDLLGMGLSDLRARILRTPQDPAATFSDDPLRMLRAVRFRHQLGFSFAPGLTEAIREQASRLDVISAERIQIEFVKMLHLPTADEALAELVDLGLMERFAPEIVAMRSVEQGRYHHLDVLGHTLVVVRMTPKEDLVLVLAALLHDIGKPATRTVDSEGATRFFGHETVGAEIAGEVLRRLRFGNEVIEAVTLLVRNHMRLGSAPTFTDTAARRLLRDLGDHWPRLIALVDADTKGLKAGVKTIDVAAIAAQVERVSHATPPNRIESPLSGREIMDQFGLVPGPAIGQAKAWLQERVIEGELAPDDREQARLLLRGYLDSMASNSPERND